MPVCLTHLQDLGCMYQYLQTKLISAQTFDGLLPFIELFFDKDELKSKLSSILEQQYNIELLNTPTENFSKGVKSLFIKCNQLNGIPSDNVHAQIISYLPSKDYRRINSVSKHFRQIMQKYPWIYHEKSYTIYVYPNYIDDTQRWQMFANHNEQRIEFRPSENTKARQISIIPNPFTPIKRWYYRCTCDEAKYDGNTHDFALDLLTANSERIHSLFVDASDVKQPLDALSKLSLPNCKLMGILGMYDSSISHVFIKCRTFKNLKYLFLSGLKVEHTNDILTNVGDALIALSLDDIYDNALNATMEPIVIPSSIEWLEVAEEHYPYQFDGSDVDHTFIDLSKCNSVIGMIVHGEMLNNIIWPTKYIIPYVQIVDEYEVDYFEHMCERNVAVRFLSGQYDADSVVTTVSINEVEIKLQNSNQLDALNCLLLRNSELNDELFCKFMRFVYKNEIIRNSKILEYKKMLELGVD
eukprot:260150_1